MARHRQSSPECPFVLHTSDNVPCGEDAPAATTEAVNVTIPEPEDTDDVGPATPHHLLHPAQLEEDASPASRSPELGLEEADYRSEAARLASFSTWTVPFIRPADLARAGFYSLNNLDSCRYCHHSFIGVVCKEQITRKENTSVVLLYGSSCFLTHTVFLDNLITVHCPGVLSVTTVWVTGWRGTSP